MIMRNTMAVACATLTIALGTVACDDESGEGRGEQQKLVSAAELCDGVFSSAAAASLENVTGERKFFRSSVGDGLKLTAQEITEEYTGANGANSTGWDTYDFCLVYAGGPSDRSDVDLEFGVANRDSLGKGDIDPALSRYRMGHTAVASERTAMIFFDCASSRLNASGSAPALIMGELQHKQEPAVEGREAKDANLTVLHSAALALAKELRCEDDGGLPDEPVLKLLP